MRTGLAKQWKFNNKYNSFSSSSSFSFQSIKIGSLSAPYRYFYSIGSYFPEVFAFPIFLEKIFCGTCFFISYIISELNLKNR